MRKVVYGLLVLAGLTVIALVAAYSWFAYSINHRGWTSVDEHAGEEMHAETRLPVLWLGESFDADGDGVGELELSGFQLTDRNAYDPEASGPRYETVIGYGRCKFPPVEGGCPLPLTIVFRPPCQDIEHRRDIRGSVDDIRGVEANFSGGDLTLFTRDYQIDIQGRLDSAAQRRVVQELRGANELAAGVTPGSDLPRLPEGYC